MTRHRHRALLTALVLAGCAHPRTLGDARESDFRWRFTVSERVEPLAVPDAASARVMGDSILVQGHFNTGCGTETISGSSDLRFRDGLIALSVWVQAHTSPGNACLFIDNTYEYEFAVPLRRNGPHEVRVFHIRDEAMETPPTPILVDTLVAADK